MVLRGLEACWASKECVRGRLGTEKIANFSQTHHLHRGIVILQYSLLSMFLSYHRWTPLQMTIAVYIPQFSIFTNWVFYKLFYTKKENTSNLIWSKKVCHFDRHTQKETRARWENKTNCLPKYWYPIYITYSSYLRCFVHTSEFHRNTYLKTYIETCYNASFNI